MILYKRIDAAAPLLQPKTSGSAGLDLVTLDDYRLQPTEYIRLRTGLTVSLDPGTFGLLVPRSSLFVRGLICLGVIDSDYRGEVLIACRNVGNQEIILAAGERVAQLLVIPCRTFAEEKEELDPTERGNNGFGSTGEK